MSSQQEKAAIATGRAQLRSLAAAPAMKFPTTQRNRSWLRAGFKLIRQTEKYGCFGFIEIILLPVFLTKKKKKNAYPLNIASGSTTRKAFFPSGKKERGNK